jgi:acyl-CoA dehydrogenase family protein 10
MISFKNKTLSHNIMISHIIHVFVFFLLVAFIGVDLKAMGIPSEQQLVEMYCKRMNIPVIDNWDFYVAFNFFRFAAILQGVYKRAISGIV